MFRQITIHTKEVNNLLKLGYNQREIAEKLKLSCQRINQIIHFDRHQARGYIMLKVLRGKLPRISKCKCVDCGKRAHYYDHYRGYDIENRGKVQPVCSDCNAIRVRKRGEAPRGDTNYGSKLKESTVIELRKLKKTLGKQFDEQFYAKKYNVKIDSIYKATTKSNYGNFKFLPYFE